MALQAYFQSLLSAPRIGTWVQDLGQGHLAPCTEKNVPDRHRAEVPT